MPPQKHNRQTGFALITVMLVTALVAIIASQLMYQQFRDIQRSENMLSQSQSVAVGNGLAAWVKTGLKLDLQDNQVDHLQELWAQPLLPVPFAGGEVAGQLYDLQGRLNLNNLTETNQTKRAVWEAIVKRFFQQQGFDPNLSDIIKDWVDKDNEISSYGAESETYLLKQPAYRTANQPLVMPQELRLLDGMNEAILSKIEPSITTLPKITAINVNTAPESVLGALAPWLSLDLAKSWVTEREQQPAESVADFKKFLQTQTQFEQAEIDKDLPNEILTVQTQYFLLKGRMEYGESQQQLSAILFRASKQKVTLVQRWFGIADNE